MRRDPFSWQSLLALPGFDDLLDRRLEAFVPIVRRPAPDVEEADESFNGRGGGRRRIRPPRVARLHQPNA